MKVDKFVCDRCGVEVTEGRVRFRILVDVQVDPVECRSKPVHKEIDLCVQCAGQILGRIVSEYSVPGGREFVERFNLGS